MKGRVLTHNHPLGTPLSPEDLYVLKENKLKEFRTCGRNGTYVFRYSEKLEKLPSLEAVGKEYDDLVRKLSPEYWDQIEQGMDNRIAMAILGENLEESMGWFLSLKRGKNGQKDRRI